MPSEGWKTATLGQVASCRNGAAIKQEFFRTEGIPLVRVSDFTDSSVDLHNCLFVEPRHARLWSEHRLDPGDILVATVGSWPPNWSSVVGKAVRVPAEAQEAIQNQNTCCVSARDGIADQRFLFYLLRSQAFVLHAANAAAGSANQARLPVANLARFEFEFPPLPEQRAIARILGSLDDKIELNRRMNGTLEAMARAAFKAWCVDFEPVRTKMDGRWKRGQSLPGLPAHLYDVFPNRFVESELGEIPEGWAVDIMEKNFRITMGQSPPGTTYNEEGLGLPFYQGRVDFGFRFPARRVYCSAPTRVAEAGDTLVTVRAPVGDVNMAGERCAIGRGVAAVRHVSGSRSFSYYFAQSLRPVFDRFEAGGTVFGAINREDFNSLATLVAPPALVAEFDRFSAPFDDRIEDNERESHTLAALRDALLPKLISGEIRVNSAERPAASR
jgi:type I restriction enzyme, S subunit